MKKFTSLFIKKRLYFILTIFIGGLLFLDIEECSSNISEYGNINTKMQLEQEEISKALDEVQKEMTTKGMFKSIHKKAKTKKYIADKGKYYEVGGCVRYPKNDVESMLSVANLMQMDDVIEKATTIFKGHYRHDIRKWGKLISEYQVYYVFHNNVPHYMEKWIMEGMKQWENGTKIKFIKDNSGRYNPRTTLVIKIDNNTTTGWFSRSVNREIGLALKANTENTKKSYMPTILHELGHALGLPHEHQRYDRHDHGLWIGWDAIDNSTGGDRSQYEALEKRAKTKKNTFLWWTWYTWEGTDITVTDYDWESIMHYPTLRGDKSNKKGYGETTMTKRGEEIPRSTKISKLDYETINYLYP